MTYQVGKYYEVLEAFGIWGMGAPRWWVVFDSPLHEDMKHLGFAPWHLHVDARFLAKRFREQVKNGVDVTFSHPLQWFFDPKEPNHELIRPHYGGSTTITGIKLSLAELHERIKLCTRRRKRKCLQEIPRWPRHLAYGEGPKRVSKPESWKALHAEFDGRAAPGGVCPHKGANLSSLPVDPDGLTTCPLHGARVRCTYG